MDEELWEAIAPMLGGEARFRPPRVRDIAGTLDLPEEEIRRLAKLLARMGRLHEISHDHFFLRDVVGEMVAIAAELDAAHGLFSAAQFRDRLDNGRKVAILILEFLDRHGVTLRRGDLRRVNPRRLDLFPRDAGDAAGAAPSEEKRPRWGGRTSNPVGAVRRSRVGSTPTLFRHFDRGIRMTDTAIAACLDDAHRRRQAAEHRRAGAPEGSRPPRRRAPRSRAPSPGGGSTSCAPPPPPCGAPRSRRPSPPPGAPTLLAEAGWTGATEAQREVAEKFVPVAQAVAAAAAGEEADPAAALAAFEAWYAETRQVPFLALMEREVVELPLVEV